MIPSISILLNSRVLILYISNHVNLIHNPIRVLYFNRLGLGNYDNMIFKGWIRFMP